VKNDKIFETIQKKSVCMGYVLMGGRLRKSMSTFSLLMNFSLVEVGENND
jgi:hypothetical protein